MVGCGRRAENLKLGLMADVFLINFSLCNKLLKNLFTKRLRGAALLELVIKDKDKGLKVKG